MDFKELPLKYPQMKLTNQYILKENILKDRREPSKMYLKHMKSLKVEQGLCQLLLKKEQRSVSKQVLHCRISQNYEKLYDMSPARKKIKLQNARLSFRSINVPKKIEYNKSQSCINSTSDLDKLFTKNPSHSQLQHFRLASYKNLIPKLRKLKSN
ncbi:hypothetical protein SteCoe_19979 [Stentor coeruleus]|uniref:Uncharacterized protein n=1 Tax=Stentor coeruleus TaxID=5963 RepID=A0A1R2BSV0_9CILI|nr:hypothetical protein SteCoe_19979 [Stentor coeruleus]